MAIINGPSCCPASWPATRQLDLWEGGRLDRLLRGGPGALQIQYFAFATPTSSSSSGAEVPLPPSSSLPGSPGAAPPLTVSLERPGPPVIGDCTSRRPYIALQGPRVSISPSSPWPVEPLKYSFTSLGVG